MGILEGIIGPLLQKYLGAYFEGLDTLDISLLSSQTTLSNLKLKTSALDELELPIAVQHGLLEKLYLKVPILSLGSEPVIVHISGLHIVAGPKHRDSASDTEERERLERTKKSRLQLADLLGMDQTDEELDDEAKLKKRRKAEEDNDSVLGKLRMKILSNIQVKVENIHIRYQDDLSNPENPFALGVTLDELYAESADENWTPGWVKNTKSTIIRKLVRLQNLCIYFDTLSKNSASEAQSLAAVQAQPGAMKLPIVGIPQTPTSTTTMAQKAPSIATQIQPHDPVKRERSDIIYKFANDLQMCKVLTELTYKKSRTHQPPHNYILEPFSAQLKLTMDISEDMAQFTRPKIQLEARVDDIGLSINQAQFFGGLDLFQYFSLYINSLKYLALRPAQLNDKTLHLPENRSKLARLRWSYVIACVRSDVRKKVDSWSWSNLIQRKKDRATYTDLYKKLKTPDKKLRPQEEEQLAVLEKILDYDDIIVYRKLAYASIQRDKRIKKRKKHAALEEKSGSRSATPASATSSPKTEKKEEKKEESILDRLFGKSDKEKAKEKEREKEKERKKEAERLEKEKKEKEKAEKDKDKKDKKDKPSSQGATPPHTPVSKSPAVTPAPSPAPSALPVSSPSTPSGAQPSKFSIENVDEEQLLKELYETIGFDDKAVHEHSDYPKDYVHTKLSFVVAKGHVNLAEVDPTLPMVAQFTFANVYTGVRLSGVSSVQLDGYVEKSEMFEFHTLGGLDKPFPVVVHDEIGGKSFQQHILSFTVGIKAPSAASASTEPVDLDLSVMAYPLLITLSRPFVDRLLVFFDLYGRDDITEHLSELASQTLDNLKQRAEAQIKYALGARQTLLVNACVHAPRVQVPSDYRDPLSSRILVDLGIISVVADTTQQPDTKAALTKGQQHRETKALAGSQDSIMISEDYFYDRIMLKLTGIHAGVVSKRTEGTPNRPPVKDAKDMHTLLHKINTSIVLSICNTPSPDLPRARLDATVDEIKVTASKEKLAVLFEVIKTAVQDTRPRDPVREAEFAEKARLRRLQQILWNNELGDDAPALHALLQGMDAVNRRRQGLVAFLDSIEDSDAYEYTADTITDSEDISETEESLDGSGAIPRMASQGSNLGAVGSTKDIEKLKERVLRSEKVRPKKQKLELKLFEGRFIFEGVSILLSEKIDTNEYPVITLQLAQIGAQLQMSDQSIVLNTSLHAFAIQEHITARTKFGVATGLANTDHYLIRSVTPADAHLIKIQYEQLDRRCVRYANIDHKVQVAMQGLEVTVSRICIASLIVVSTELTTAAQQALGIQRGQSTVVSLHTSTASLTNPDLSEADNLSQADSESDSEQLSASEKLPDLEEEIEAIRKKEAKKAANLAMAKALAQEGISLADIELSLTGVSVQLAKEGVPFFRVAVSDAQTHVSIYPDHTTVVEGSLNQLRGSARTNEAGIPLWTVAAAQAKSPTTGVLAPAPLRTPGAWNDILYIDGNTLGNFSLKIYDPSMPNFPGHDMEVAADVAGLRVIALFRVVDEIVTYLTAFTSMLGVIGYLKAATATDSPPPKTKLNIHVATPIIYIPRSTESREYLSLELGSTDITNRLDAIAGICYDFMTINVTGLNFRAVVKSPDSDAMVQRNFIDNLDLSLSVNRAIEGNDEHLLPDVDVSSTVPSIHVAIAAADLAVLVGLLAGNLSEFVLRKDEVELKEVIGFLESVNLVQFVSGLVPVATVDNLPLMPFVKVKVAIGIGVVGATLYRGAGKLKDGADSSLLNASASNLELNVAVASDEGIQVALNVERVEISDCSADTTSKFRYVLLPNTSFGKAPDSLSRSSTSSPSVENRRSSVLIDSRRGSVSSTLALARSGVVTKPQPFIKLKYEDRPAESIEFVSVTVLHPRFFIFPSIIQEVVSIVLPIIGSMQSALDTWHQRLLFGSEAEQKDVLARSIVELEVRHRDELTQLIAQHRTELTNLRSNKNSLPKDEETMLKHQELDRKAILERHKKEMHELKVNGIVPKWQSSNEMRVKVEIENPELCILEQASSTVTPAFVIAFSHVMLRLSLLPERIHVKPHATEFGIFKAIMDSSDVTSIQDQVLLLQPLDVHGDIAVKPATPKSAGSVDLLLHLGLFQTIVSYRDIRLGVGVYRSFEPMIDAILQLVDKIKSTEESKHLAAQTPMLADPPQDLVIQLHVKQMLFSLLNDHNATFVVPVAKVTVENIVALIQQNEALNLTVQLPNIMADGFNNTLSSYEPIMEPWNVDVKVLERDNVFSIPVSAMQRPLNLNVTKSLLDAVFGIVAFADEMKVILSPPPPADDKSARGRSISTSGGSAPTTGLISSPLISRSHHRKPSATLTVHEIAALGLAPALATPTPGSPMAPQQSLSGSIKSPPSPSPSTSTAVAAPQGAERSFDPFLVRNDTNQLIKVWKSTEGPESGFEIHPGEQVSLRSQKASKHAADTTFFVNVEVYIGDSILALEKIAIEKVHTHIYSLTSNKLIKVLSEVTLQQGTKILTLSTVHNIRNQTMEAIEVRVISKGEGAETFDMTIPSQQTRSIPFRFFAYTEVLLRPVGGYQWYSRKEKVDEAIMNCKSDDPSSNRSWSCCLSYSSRSIDGGKDYCLTLSPQLILENLLCSQLLLKTYTPNIKVFSPLAAMTNLISGGSLSPKSKTPQPQQIIEDDLPNKELAFDIEVGDQLPVYAAQAASSVIDQNYRIQIPGYNWSDPIDMRDLFNKRAAGKSYERSVTMTDVSGRLITLYALIFSPSAGSMKVSFFSKYWLINQTGLCLAYRANSKSPSLLDDPRSINMTGNPRTWYKGDFMSEKAAQKAYYSNNELSFQVVAAGGGKSPWTPSVPLEQKDEDSVQQAKIENVEIGDTMANRLYCFRVEIATAPGKHWRTKEVRITPAFLLVNKTKYILYYNQFKSGSATCFDLEPGERVPFHPSTSSKSRRFIFTTKEAYYSLKDPSQACWSMPFKINEMNSWIFKIRIPATATAPAKDQLISVQIIERKNVHCVVFRDSPEDTIPFYKIDNKTTNDIFVEQKDVSGSRDRVPAGTISNWYWDNPLQEPSDRVLIMRMADPASKNLSDSYNVVLDQTVPAKDARDGRASMVLGSWDVRLKSYPGKVRVTLVQQGFLKILRLENASTPSRSTTPAARPLSVYTPNQPGHQAVEEGDVYHKPDPAFQVTVEVVGIGISLVDHWRSKVPTELLYMTLLGIKMDLQSCKQVHTVTLNVNKLQVDNQMKFAPEPVLLTSVRAPLKGAKRASDMAPFLMTTIAIDTSEKSIVYIRQMALELQVLDLSVDQPFILAMAGFGEGLARYIASQAGLEQSVLTPETTMPDIDDASLVAPNFFVQAVKIWPMRLVLTLAKGNKTESVPTTNSETLIKRITDPILSIGSIDRTSVQFGEFEMQRVFASTTDLGMRFAEHYKNQGLLNLSKVIVNYLNIIKIFSSDPPPRSRIRLPRYFPPDHLVVPYDTAKSYGQNLLVAQLSGRLSSEVYLFHSWVGGARRPHLILVTTKTMAIVSLTEGLIWEEKLDGFVHAYSEVQKPDPKTGLTYGDVIFFFDPDIAGNPDQVHAQRRLQGLPKEQLDAIMKELQRFKRDARSPAHTLPSKGSTQNSLKMTM